MRLAGLDVARADRGGARRGLGGRAGPAAARPAGAQDPDGLARIAFDPVRALERGDLGGSLVAGRLGAVGVVAIGLEAARGRVLAVERGAVAGKRRGLVALVVGCGA